MKNLFFLLIAVPVVSFAQVSYNPFASIGKKANVVTLSNGRYKEMYGGDTVKRIGNILFDVRTEKIVTFLDEGDTTSYLSKNEGDLSTRWLSIDPLAAKYPYLSPYVFVGNSPIVFVDPDGKQISINYSYMGSDGQTWTGSLIWNYGDKYDKSKLFGGNNKFVEETIQSLTAIIETNSDIMKDENNKEISYLKQLANTSRELVDLQIDEATSIEDVNFDVRKIYSSKSDETPVVGILKYHTRSGTIGKDKNGNDVLISPAGGLAHELGHAHRFFINKLKYGAKIAQLMREKNQGTSSLYYGNKEEAETTITYEWKAVLKGKLGTGFRRSHDEDKAYETSSPTSTSEAKK